MEMLNRAIEDAADFRDMMRKIASTDDLARHKAQQSGQTPELATSEALGLERQPGENRAEHRARLKRERRAASRSVKA